MDQQSIISYVCIVLSLISVLQGVHPQMTIVVAKDGSGHFTTISQAISAAASLSSKITYIKIREGKYYENVLIPEEKINLQLVGDRADKTIISGSRSRVMGFPTYDTATVRISANGFVAKEVTFENTAGPNMNQSVAVTTKGLYSAFYRCRFLGYQDTLYVWHGIQFFRECDIYRTVDFIFGAARAIFQNCNIYARRPRQGQSNTITAQAREAKDKFTGIVMQNCTIKAAPDLKPEFNVRTYLGRPWSIYSTTVIMQSHLDALIDPQGWLEWPGQGVDKVYYAEYQNQGSGAIFTNRVSWARNITRSYTEAESFTVRNFIHGEKWLGLTKIPRYLDL